MASAFSHAVAALSLGSLFRWTRPPIKYWLAGALCAAAPDFDSIGFAFGIRYGDVFGHRGFTHSLLFAVILGAAVAGLFFRAEIRAGRGARVWAYLILATASHGLLDAITNGGLGVAFFSPFDTARYFFPFRPVAVSPINVARFFQGRGLQVMASELLWIWLPALIVAGIAEAVRLGASSRRPAREGKSP
jgi:inner membrane protein